MMFKNKFWITGEILSAKATLSEFQYKWTTRVLLTITLQLVAM